MHKLEKGLVFFRKAEKFIQAASQQKTRVQVVGHSVPVKSLSQQEILETGGKCCMKLTLPIRIPDGEKKLP